MDVARGAGKLVRKTSQQVGLQSAEVGAGLCKPVVGERQRWGPDVLISFVRTRSQPAQLMICMLIVFYRPEPSAATGQLFEWIKAAILWSGG